MESADVHLLFPIPVYKTKLDLGDSLKLFQSYLECFEYYDYESNHAMGTYDQNVLNNPLFKKLKEKIEEHLNNFLFNILKIKNIEVSHSNSWITKFKKGDYSVMHRHSFSFFSGVLYLKIPEGDCGGDIVFHKGDNHTTISTLTFGCEFSEDNMLNSSDVSYKPENGMLLIFPSHLNHFVTENTCDENRHSLAFNYFVSGDLGCDSQKLNLKVF